ncbi:MAG: T9SS type A sorting domain-containing protein [bacterium]
MKKNRLIFASIFVLLMISVMNAQVPTYAWLTSASGINEEIPYGITVDQYGNNIYVTGKFQSKPLNMGNGISITHTGTKDYFVAKYDHEGLCVWAHEGGNQVTTEGRDVVIDANGDVIVTGALYGNSVFGGITLVGSGNWDVVVVKYNAAGDVLWAKKGSSYRQDRGNSITVDAAGNYLVTGYFGGTGVDTVNFNGYKLTGYGDRDIFVAKYNPSGDLLWVKAAGSSNSGEEGWGVVTDAQNNVYVCGQYAGTSNFGANQVTSVGGRDVFLTKLTPDGTYEWVKTFGGPKDDVVSDIDILSNGTDLVLGGYFIDTVNVGGNMILSNGADDGYVAMYKTSGDFSSFYHNGSVLGDRVYAVSAGKDNKYFIGGYYYGTVTYNGTPYTSTGGRDLFTALCVGADTVLWFKSAGGTDEDYCTDIAADKIGNLFLTGNFNLTASFDEGTLTSAGDDELYVARLGHFEVPVELVSFGASYENGAVSLNWITATETNNNGFEIERSLDKGTFAKIGFVEGNGTSTEINKYSFIDNYSSNKTVYYRLKQIDFDGSFTYSDVVEVNVTTPKDFVLMQNYPNPFNPSTSIQYQLASDGYVTLKIFDLLGREVETLVNKLESAGLHKTNFTPKGNFNSGVYFYSLKVSDKLTNNIIYSQNKKMLFIK